MKWEHFFDKKRIDMKKSMFVIGYGDYQRTILVSKNIEFGGNILYDQDQAFFKANESLNIKENNCIVIKNNKTFLFNQNRSDKSIFQELSSILK